MRRSQAILGAALVVAVAVAGTGPAQTGLHGASDGHLPPSSKNVELVGALRLTTAEASVGDVSALGAHAYMAAWGASCDSPDAAHGVLETLTGPGTAGRQARAAAESVTSQVAPQVSEDDLRGGGGIHVVDFSVPQAPVKVGFIPAPEGTYVGEGVHVRSIETASFDGDLLVVNLEPCDYSSRSAGGVALYDVTDPLAPVVLAEGVGDRDATPYFFSPSVHPSHSAFLWQQGARAYVVMVDNMESGFGDVDVLDVTNPRRARHIADVGLADWPRANRAEIGEAGGDSRSYHHDVWVKKVGAHWLMLLSYWDSGWVVLNVDNPRRPRFVRDSDYPIVDRLNGGLTEGNAHQAIWTLDNRYIIGASEDYFAKLTYVVGGSQTGQWFSQVRELPGAPRITRAGTGSLTGRTTYAGLACDPLGIAPPQPAPRGTTKIAVVMEGVCGTAAKLDAARRAGYHAAIVATSHDSSMFGAEAQRVSCAEPTDGRVRLRAICINHTDFHRMFRSAPHYVAPAGALEPELGRRGDDVFIVTLVDGSWGDLRLLDARTMRQRDQYQIAEALDPKYDEGFGWLTVHEVKPDPRPSSKLIYASWYSAGMRVLSHAGGRLRELGHFISDHGSDYWGVLPVSQPDGPPLVLMSDMHFGLEILRYTG